MNHALKEQSGLNHQTGLFAGLLSSNNGTWIPMPQLRRVAATVAWVVFFCVVGYASSQVELASPIQILVFAVGAFIVAAGSYAVFIAIGGRAFQSERQQ